MCPFDKQDTVQWVKQKKWVFFRNLHYTCVFLYFVIDSRIVFSLYDNIQIYQYAADNYNVQYSLFSNIFWFVIEI